MGLVLVCVEVDVMDGIGWWLAVRLEPDGLMTCWRRVVMTEGEEEQEGERTRAAIGLKLRWK